MRPLLHLTTPTAWRAALAVGSVAPPSLLPPPLGQGFVHLSWPEQVHLPAQALFDGRDDVLALVVDPARLAPPVLEEANQPQDPPSRRFPHLYGPLPTAAVVSVVPYRAAPAGPWPTTPAQRAHAFDRWLARRRAAALVDVPGGWAVLDPRVPASREHGCLWLDGVDAPTAAGAAEEVLGAAGLPYRRVVTDDPVLTEALRRSGWEADELRVMAARLPGAAARRDPRVVAVEPDVVGPLWRDAWRRDAPGVTDAELDQLVAREGLADAVVRVVDLAVLEAVEGGYPAPVAAAQLRLDGATAALEAVMTSPAARGRGLGDALVADACARAAEVGCDLLLLTADAGDWPRHWYGRRGFDDLGPRWELGRRRRADEPQV